MLYLLLAEDGEDFAAAAQDLQRVASAGVTALADSLDRRAELLELQGAVAAEEARSSRARQQADDAAAELQRLLAASQERQAALERTYAAELAEQRRRESEAAAAALAAAQETFLPPSTPSVPPDSGAPESALIRILSTVKPDDTPLSCRSAGALHSGPPPPDAIFITRTRLWCMGSSSCFLP